MKFKLSKEFINSLQLNSEFSNVAHEFLKPDFAEFDSEDHSILEMLWSLLEERPQKGEDLNNYLEKVKHQAIGLMDKINFNQLLIYFKSLYPQLSKNQKLVANYIVWQFLSYHKLEMIQLEKSTILNLKAFLRCNIKWKTGLGSQGVAINEHYSEWSKCNFAFYNLPLIKNYFLLNQWCQKSSNDQLNFDVLVDLALSKSSSERPKEVSLIANELRALSLSFYQSVPISDFCSKKNKNSPSFLDSLTSNFNQLNNYFIVKILNQPSANRVNALRLILELACEICPLDTEYILDLNHLMLIASVLNTVCISRLKNCFNALNSKEHRLINEIDQIVSKEKNSKWMREICQVYKSSLAFPGNFLTDLTFAKNGNDDKTKAKVQAEAIGTILLNILGLKERIELDTHCHFSNLPTFLKQYQPMNEDDLYAISLKVQPRISDVIILPTKKSDFTAILKQLDEEFLNNKLIPSVNFHGTTYHPNLLAIKLIKYFAEQVTILKQSPIDQHYLLLNALNQLNTTIEKLVEVNNHYYYPLYHQEKLNLYYFLSQIDKLKEALDPKTTQPKKSSKLESATLTHTDKFETNKNLSSRQASFFAPVQEGKSEKEGKSKLVKARTTPLFCLKGF